MYVRNKDREQVCNAMLSRLHMGLHEMERIRDEIDDNDDLRAAIEHLEKTIEHAHLGVAQVGAKFGFPVGELT